MVPQVKKLSKKKSELRGKNSIPKPRWREAYKDSLDAIDLDRDNLKGYLQGAKASFHLNMWEKCCHVANMGISRGERLAEGRPDARGYVEKFRDFHMRASGALKRMMDSIF